VALLVVIAVLAVVVVGRSSAATCTGVDRGIGVGYSATVACPIPGASQVSLAQAAAVLGKPFALPARTGIEAVWSSRTVHSSTGQSVAVTYPSPGFAVRYTTPVPYTDALANYESYVRSAPGARVVYLDGVPALIEASTRWTSVEFVSNGTMIALMGTADRAVMENAARSILAQAGS
jgi:hypothetical protein